MPLFQKFNMAAISKWQQLILTARNKQKEKVNLCLNTGVNVAIKQNTQVMAYFQSHNMAAVTKWRLSKWQSSRWRPQLLPEIHLNLISSSKGPLEGPNIFSEAKNLYPKLISYSKSPLEGANVCFEAQNGYPGAE